MRRRLAIATALCGLVPAQQGDRPGERQELLPDSVVVPPATPRSPAEERATFALPPGFRIDLVASEPLIGDPVVATFDSDNRLWVVEMRGFMPDVDGRGEDAPVGRIRVLTDTDRDGAMDAGVTFLDGLVLPRGVLPLRGGALVLEPPNLWWCPDRDGDLRADGREKVLDGIPADNPEHATNGLLWGLDNRIHLADDKRMLRWTAAGFAVEAGSGGGQWGITQDDRGRLYFNYNEDWLRCDLVPGVFGVVAAGVGGMPGLNHRLMPITTCYPIRITPGVNRGYQKGRLVDYKLAIHTAVCGPHCYRDDALPCVGDVFACEPAANLVRRIRLVEPDGVMRGENPYEAEKRDFLCSTDERFRPVNLFGGPDGALYVVDMYRGVIQHRLYVTSFLRDQIVKRKLEQPIGLGRIWAVRRDAGAVAVAPPLADAEAATLVAALAAAKGTQRDLALQELVQRGLRRAAPLLRQQLAAHDAAPSRIALLSALAGLGELESVDLRRALRDPDAGVVAMAVQLAVPLLRAGDGMLWLLVEAAAGSGPPNVAWHVAAAAGAVLDSPVARKQHGRALGVLTACLARGADDALLRGIVAAQAHCRGVEVLRLLAERPQVAEAARLFAYRDVARTVARTRDADAQLAVLDFAASRQAIAEQEALLRGVLAALPKPEQRAGWLVFATTPGALTAIVRCANPRTAPLATELLAAVALHLPEPAAAPSGSELARIRAGERAFATVCAACHQLDGNGMQGLAPPLRDSEWVQGPKARLIRIALHGVKGPIEIQGQAWSLEMPGQGLQKDEDLAAILSYLRQAFGNRAGPVTTEEIAALRRELGKRTEPWTADELLMVR